MHLPRTLLVASGGVVGAALRWATLESSGAAAGASGWSAEALLLLINVVGCFVLGALWARTRPDDGGHQNLRALVGVGFCGGLTSFSSFAVQVAQSLDAGLAISASAWTLATVFAVLIAVGLGHRLFSQTSPS